MSSTPHFTTIVTPYPSSSTRLPSLNPDSSHPFTHFPPKPFKTLSLKPHIFTLSPLIYPIHLCHSATSSAFGDVGNAISDDDVEAETEEEEEVTDDYDEEEGELEVKESDGKDGSGTSEDGRVYVGNLPYTMTSSQLSDIFSQAGKIKSVEIIYDKMTDRSRGFGFVTMESGDDAREAIRMFDGSQIGGRTVRVNIPEVPKGGERKVLGAKIRIGNQSFVDTPHKIYAGNLGWGVTMQGLADAFADQPGFVSAKVVYERESGRSRGFGFISFSSPEAAQSALSTLNEMELEGRPLRLNVAAGRSPSPSEANAEQGEVVSDINS